MRNTHPLAEDIQRVLAAINTQNSQEEPTPADEPLETYHIYPMQGGIFITKENTGVVDTNPPHQQKPPLLPLTLAILCSLLLMSYLVFLSTIPNTKQLTVIRSFTLPVQVLPPVVESRSETIVASGRGHQDATLAHGTITLYNGSFTQQFIPQKMLFTTASNVQIVTDQQVTIPAGNPPTYGQATVSAHTIIAGAQGNIPAFAINTICCAESVKAVNTEAFRGGRNTRDYTFVRQEDINNGVPSLKQAVFHQAQTALQKHLTSDQVFIPLPCSTIIKPTLPVGAEANSVTVTVSATCSAITYSQKSLQEKVRQLVHIPPGFMLVSFQVHTIDTAIKTDHKSITITVAITALLCYKQSVKPPVK